MEENLSYVAEQDNDAPFEAYDPRGIANLILDEARRRDLKIFHTVLQKLVYFAHGIFLTRRGVPLVSGYFEAWERGPVHPVLYREFKKAAKKPINFRARSMNLKTGELFEASKPTDSVVVKIVEEVVESFGRMTLSAVVEISHAENSPWHVIAKEKNELISSGLRISNDLIESNFKFHKVSVHRSHQQETPDEPAPLT